MNMLSRTVLFVMILAWGGGPGVHAQENQEFLQDLNDIRDPFQSQLPPPKLPPPAPVVQPKIEIPEVPAPPAPPVVEHTPVVQPIPRPDQKIEEIPVVVKGLVWNSDIPQAIVNDKVVRVGDEVSGMKVVSIQKKGIEFVKNGMTVFIHVSGLKEAAEKKL